MANKTKTAAAPRNALTAKSVGNFLSNYAIIIIIAIMVLVVGFVKDNFWTKRNL